ncbi:MAG: transcriptional repressor [Gammaproteobacteria bacterium]|nr:transcriptional repressor [Gammaproteobacteria bacterium]
MFGSTLLPPVAREDIPATLMRFGISPTPQRVEVAALLLERTQHLSADQVLARLSGSDASVSKATVYNTLGLFAERGLVREVMVDATKVFYDSNTSAHHHFFNIDDGTLLDVPSGAVVIDQLPAAPAGTCTDSVDIVIRVRNQA